MKRNNNQKINNSGLKKCLIGLGIAAAMTCAPAFAEVINFEAMLPTTNESGTSISQGAYNMAFVEGAVFASWNVISPIGTVINSSDPLSCEIAGCPSGATGQFLAIQNDGAVTLTRSTGTTFFSVGGFDFAFIAPVGNLQDGDYGRLQLSGELAFGGGTISTALAFPGQSQPGKFAFGASALDQAFRDGIFKSLTINACIWDANGDCSNSLESPAFNQAQFSIDNISVTDVPEPASMLLIGVGIGALGLTRRRAARAARPSTTSVSL